ncbi:hypothetical protein CRH09_27065 [Nocardia terpenica]|uniref:Uncharacterized protein n=1 Tax=Nocardia terpenica TaxID=455432 RepID=A0A291RNW1_9NOCA|nr:hypothetical protein CRH09_27065 [Nocardia terpenica]
MLRVGSSSELKSPHPIGVTMIGDEPATTQQTVYRTQSNGSSAAYLYQGIDLIRSRYTRRRARTSSTV